MDLNEQVARRRAEMAKQERQAKDDLRALDHKRREAVVNEVADDLSLSGVPVHRQDEDLVIDAPAPPPIDVEGLKQAAAKRLLNREARKLWTAGDNWLVISLIVGGITLVHVAGLGLIPLLIGLARRSVINKQYRSQVLALYPQLATLTT